MKHTYLSGIQITQESRLLKFKFGANNKAPETPSQPKEASVNSKISIPSRLATISNRIDNIIKKVPEEQKKAWKDWKEFLTTAYANYSMTRVSNGNERRKLLETYLSSYETQLTDREEELSKIEIEKEKTESMWQKMTLDNVQFFDVLKPMITYPKLTDEITLAHYNLMPREGLTLKYLELSNKDATDWNLKNKLVKARDMGFTFEVRQDPSAGFQLTIRGKTIPRGSTIVYINPHDGGKWKEELSKALDAYTWQPSSSPSSR